MGLGICNSGSFIFCDHFGWGMIFLSNFWFNKRFCQLFHISIEFRFKFVKLGLSRYPPDGTLIAYFSIKTFFLRLWIFHGLFDSKLMFFSGNAVAVILSHCTYFRWFNRFWSWSLEAVLVIIQTLGTTSDFQSSGFDLKVFCWVFGLHLRSLSTVFFPKGYFKRL